MDLCSLTGEKELAIGKVEGMNVEILENSTGRIVFKVTQLINENDAWSGILNSSRFRSKINGATTVMYKVQ